MKKKFAKRLLSWVMAAAMVISMLPISAMAAGTGGNVAKIGDTQYATLDEAVAEATEGATIVLLQDCELTKGFNKTLTFTGDGKISINKQLTSNGEGWMCFGLYDPSRVLTFDGPGVEVEWNSEVGTSPWLMLSLSGTMNVTNGAKVTFTVDSGSTGSRNAIYMNEGSSINVTNGSSFTINGNETAGKEGQGIQLDKTGTATINVTGNSTFTIDGTNRGYVNSPTVYVKDSTFTVQNCTANGSNGGNFTAVNSKIYYLDNAGHGLSADDVIIKNSEFVADNNGYYGIKADGDFLVDKTSKVTVTRNSGSGDYAGLKLRSGVTDGKVEKGAVVTITDNYCSGLSNNGVCVFEEGAKLTIMNNDNRQGGETGSHGGGIYNSGSGANLTLPSDAVIYNNHALTDGDDIYNTGTIIFGKVDPTWVLDDCDHLIDGWYDDAENARWAVHPEGDTDSVLDESAMHAVEFEEFDENGLATVTGPKALKAAHGKDPIDKTSYPGLDKQVSDANEPDWTDGVNAAAGQDVNFKLTSNVPDDLLNYIIPDVDEPEVVEPVATNALVPVEDRGHYNLTFHDRMDEELDSNDDFTVFLDSNKNGVLDENDKELTYLDDYTISYNVNHDDGTCDFEIEMDLVDLYEKDAITDEDIENATPIIVIYTATLDEEAPAGTYENTAWVTYESGSSSEVIVTVETYGLNIFKYDQATSSNEGGPTGLAGAEFTLTKDGDKDFSKTLTSGQDGTVSLEGLDAGTYYLKETKAPEGYVCSDKVVTIKIPDQTGTDNMVNVKFANSLIPHTGGMGTTLFSIVGGALIATAGVIFVISRKKRAHSAA